jgi:PKD repeat protein
VDFRYITVQAARIVITPNPGAADVGQSITLTAKNLDLGTPAGAIYEWDFNDGTTATRTADSTVSKSWNTAGTYTVKVRIKDPASGKTYGTATATVAVSAPLPIWRFTSMTSTFSGVAAQDIIFYVQGLVGQDVGGLMDPIRAVPSSGRLFYHANPVSVGGATIPQGIYVMGEFTDPNDFTFSLSRPAAPLARPTAGPYPDQFGDELILDAATQNGSLNSGTMGGKSATRIRDLSHFPLGAGGVHTTSHWEVTATKNGTQLTGKITYYIEQWIADPFQCTPPASINCVVRFAGTLKWEFPFTAVRVR